MDLATFTPSSKNSNTTYLRTRGDRTIATERTKGGLTALFNGIFQTIDGRDAYETVEEKAGLLNTHEISPQALTAITLLVAESDPKDKAQMIGLILLLIGAADRYSSQSAAQ